MAQRLGAGHAGGGGAEVGGVAGPRVHGVRRLRARRLRPQGAREVGHVRPRVRRLPRVGVLPLPQRQLLELRRQPLRPLAPPALQRLLLFSFRCLRFLRAQVLI